MNTSQSLGRVSSRIQNGQKHFIFAQNDSAAAVGANPMQFMLHGIEATRLLGMKDSDRYGMYVKS